MRHSQQGFSLLEAMIALVVFSFGILGLLGLEANAVKVVVAAKNRSDAGNLADQIIGQMWADRPNLPSYAHKPVAGATPCAPTGAASSSPTVQAWLATVAATLPGGSASVQQISVTSNNIVTVTVCWKLPQESVSHNFSETAQING